MSQPYMKVTSDFTKTFNETVSKFKRDAVLVGIPEEETDRNNDDAEPAGINNATLLAINNFGSPEQNIPARPVMKIGIKNAQAQIADIFAKGAKDALTKGVSQLSVTYNRAGIVASNSIKKAINSQEGILPPSEVTLANRESSGFNGTKALIVTGQMRNAITYVVKGED